MKELTSEEVSMYEESDVCYICKRAFSEDDPKVYMIIQTVYLFRQLTIHAI